MTGAISLERTSPAKRSDNRNALKRATAHVHDVVEKEWFLNSEFTDQDVYSAWLRAMFRVHAELGVAAAKKIADPRWIDLEATRVNCLAADLNEDVPDQTTSPVTASNAWGVLYALSGSALGATVLIASPSLRTHWPRQYLLELNNFAKSGGVRVFFDHLNSQVLDADEAEAGAVSVFSALSAQTPHR